MIEEIYKHPLGTYCISINMWKYASHFSVELCRATMLEF